MGRAGPRRPNSIRVPDPRRSAGGLKLGDDPEEAGELSGTFGHFDAATIAKYDQKKRQSLLTNPGIIRNRLKIEAAIQNSRAFLAIQREFGTFDKYIWQFVGSEPRQNAWKSIKEVPAKTPASDAMSKDLKQKGFKFIGSKICYAFMQAVGMVNDHLVECFRHGELAKVSRRKNG